MKQQTPTQKLKFYDRCFKTIPISIIIILVSGYLKVDVVGIVAGIVIAIVLLNIKFGMFYHQFKNKKFIHWAILSLLTTLVGLGTITFSIFYFKVMRKEFKEGRGVYGNK